MLIQLRIRSHSQLTILLLLTLDVNYNTLKLMPILGAKRLTLNAKRGFTMIEMMITVGVLAILASFTIYTFSSAPQKARDGERKTELTQVKKVLEQVKADCQGAAYYPNLGGGSDVARYTNLGNYLTDPDLKYIPNMPTDPKNSNLQQYKYGFSDSSITNKCPKEDGSGNLTINGSSDFALWVMLERTDDPDSLASRTKCNGIPTWLNPNWLNQPAGYYVVCNM